MNALNLARLVAALGVIYMSYVAVVTSFESNLFAEWHLLSQIPWMMATVKDFYLNMALVYAWIFYRERSWALRVLWLVLCVCLGSIATYTYLLIQLMAMRPGENFIRLLQRNELPS